jgi:DNA-binding beta-propeller fold protein YncE
VTDKTWNRGLSSGCTFHQYGKYPFPQANAGSSSALTFYTRRPPWLDPTGSFPWLRTGGPFPWLRPWLIPWWLFGTRRYLLFLTQRPGSEPIYFLDPYSGVVNHSIQPTRNPTIGSMAWDGTSIRVANVTGGSGSINSLDPSTGSQVSSIPAPAGRGEGMTHDGSSLYYSTGTQIHEIDPASGAVARSFPVPGGGSCRALTSDGQGLIFAGDTAQDQITVFESTSLRVLCQFPAPGSGSRRVEGLAFDRSKRTLFIANQDENTIYWGVVS